MGSAGFYNPDIDGPFAVVPHAALSDGFRSDVVLFHEYMHHFMLQHFAGLSVLVRGRLCRTVLQHSLRARREHRHRLLRRPSRYYPARRPAAAPRSDVRHPSDFGRQLFYANAWALTHYLLISAERPNQLNRYINLIGTGWLAEVAAQEAFGGLDTLERDFRRYRGGRTIPTLILRNNQLPAPGPIAIEPLGRAEEALVWLSVEYRTEPEGGYRLNLVRHVRTRVAQMADDPVALQFLADVEALGGDLEAAGRAADAVMARRPDAPRALLRKGLTEIALLERARDVDRTRWTAAREWIRRANAASPDDPSDSVRLLPRLRAAGHAAPGGGRRRARARP